MEPEVLRVLSDLAYQHALRAIANTPAVRVRAGVVAVGTNLTAPVLRDRQVLQIRLDGDSATTYAQNISGEPWPAGSRVMCLYAPGVGKPGQPVTSVCYVIGPVDHWPVERGLLVSAESSGGNVSDSAGTPTTLADLGPFIAPASGRVRVTMEGLGARLVR